MICLRTRLRQATGAGAALFVLLLSPAAYASSIDTAAFTLVNTNADGSVTTPSSLYPADLSSFDLTGGNNGSGLFGQTEYIGTALSTGIVQFLWSYTSCYPPNEQPPSPACDLPGFDWTGYLVGSTLTQLSDTDTQGVVVSADFAVSAGALFGWYVDTVDNQGEPGTITVSDVTFTPTNVAPEPGTLLLCIASVIILAAVRRSIPNTQIKQLRKI